MESTMDSKAYIHFHMVFMLGLVMPKHIRHTQFNIHMHSLLKNLMTMSNSWLLTLTWKNSFRDPRKQLLL